MGRQRSSACLSDWNWTIVEPADCESPALAKMGMAVPSGTPVNARKNSHETAPELLGLCGSWRAKLQTMCAIDVFSEGT